MSTDYPRWPMPVKAGANPNENLDVLMGYYDLLTGVGLYVLPKQADKKIPDFKYWRKENKHILRQRETALEEQQRPDISGWCVVTGPKSERLIVIDLDTSEIEAHGESAEAVYAKIQKLSPSAFVLRTPSNGVHIYYKLPFDIGMIGNVSPPLPGVDLRGDGGQVVSLGGINRYEGKYADKKGVPDGHVGSYELLSDGEYSSVPGMGLELYTWLTSSARKKKKQVVSTRNDERVRKHLRQPKDIQDAQAMDFLSALLGNWSEDADYEDFIAMWMSAWQGSGGSSAVRDFIITHPKIGDIYPSSWEEPSHMFRKTWDTHEQRDDGYTIATLRYMAIEAGWSTDTGHEIPDALCKTINVRYVTEWLNSLKEIPNRVLLMSQTGSGKTFAVSELYKRLGEPKTVIFAPSIKLATELASTLFREHGVPAELYRDSVTGATKDREALEGAHVLVTTLQTFAKKAHSKGAKMSDYGLVYFEESDQLLAQFARGGGGTYGSHVSHDEAMQGYAVIRDAMENSGTVWMVDATMSRISFGVADATRNGHHVEVVRNTWVTPKPDVTFLDTREAAYQKILQGLMEGKRVVVVADTAQAATEARDTMREVGALNGRKDLLITRATERYPQVREFIQNVNKYSGEYDLICYNSVMASGVSITETTPDMIVQIANYLTPRINLQLLNRYRNQASVYCFYSHTERLYARTADEIMAEAKRRAELESSIIQIPLAARTDNALLRNVIAAMSVSDTEMQMVAPKIFYRELLRRDGRKIIIEHSEIPVKDTKEAVKAVRTRRKAEKAKLAETWTETAPIDSSHPAKPNQTDVEVAQGEVHALIDRAFRGNITNGNIVVTDPKEIYDLSLEFARVGSILSRAATGQNELQRAEEFLMNRDRALLTMYNDVTLMTALSSVLLIYNDLGEPVSEEELTDRAPAFMAKMLEGKEKYNACVTRTRDKFDDIITRNDKESDQAKALCKILLSRVGLSQRRSPKQKRGGKGIYIENLDRAIQYLALRYADIPGYSPHISFDITPMKAEIKKRATAWSVLAEMTEADALRVWELGREGLSFDEAVSVASGGVVW